MNTLPAGLSVADKKTNVVEFFADCGTVRAHYHGQNIHFSEVPDHILNIYRREMRRRTHRCAELGITDDMPDLERLERYLMADYGEYDTIPDLAADGTTHAELSREQVIAEYGLSPREIDVLSLLAQGLSVPEVAERLFIAPTTAQVHSHNIKEKIQAKNHIEMARFAIRHHLATA